LARETRAVWKWGSLVKKPEPEANPETTEFTTTTPASWMAEVFFLHSKRSYFFLFKAHEDSRCSLSFHSAGVVHNSWS
jgi:hypothetical protein